MEAKTFPSVASFIIRFVLDEPPPSDEVLSRYHGEIRHIQSDEEMLFNSWEDVVKFLKRYVPLETETGQDGR